MNLGAFEVLIVDDLKSNLLALNGLLTRDGVIVREAMSGSEALDLMLKHDFCVALIDVNMPGMSGFELAELMRGSKRTRNIPIIFVTATATAQDFSFKGYESGAVDLLLKPLDAHAVKSKVNIFIELGRQKRELADQLATISHLLEDLKSAKDDAEKANASKTEFLAHMSHEIRSPIGAILGFSDLLKEPGNSAVENLGYTKIVERNCNQLLRLIDDILDLSKVEAGMMSIDNIDFSLAEFLTDLKAAMNLRALDKGIRFELKISSDVPAMICSDPYRLRQILDNIVGNAIKFTSVGQVELSIKFKDPTLRFECRDTGIGITEL